ncbi:tenascin-X isoform X2 [Rhinolophus sinicus]|uniref:tenascin-X isoform X2 n=1 Tax=Rhinolophus sinicus TaxID=89399 RepID=UPI003D7A2353
MMPNQCSLTSNLALLVLLGTVRAGPFSSRSNMPLPASRPPPQPGGLTAESRRGNPSSQLYEHTVEGGEKQVVFTHRINLPPSAGCGCPPGTEPPVPASEVQALRVRLEILEELVKGLKEQCTGGCCPAAAAQAGTGQTDIRSLCSLHGVFDLSRCACSCEPGWDGPTCSDPTDAGVPLSSPPSALGSCPDDCNDQGRCVLGRCVCFPGYTGPSCGWPSCPGDCHGRGRCVQGVCVCQAGFSGDDCSLRSCPRGCSQKGRCVNGRCVCNPGYTGEDCGVRSCPRGCSQKGRCEDGRCVCDPGYAGEDCSSRSCPWDCGEGGRCVDGRCVCWPGYAGEDCSTRTCPRDCRGRGRCEDGECICDAGYSGDDCGVRSCPGDCNQRGHCEDGRCVCWPGYTGPDCGARACPRDCRGRGRCENGVCVCNAGYSGEDCGVRSCPEDCRGRGRCESGRCVCWPGYTGRDCGTRACPGDCRGRGRCVDGRCVCNPGFTGEDCGSRRCPGDCRGRGHCEDGVCACDAGYEGEDCSVRSCPGSCRGRGQCLDGRCVCDDGYSGDDCGVRRCPRDCSQRGVCQDGLCTCWEGYVGEDCALRTCPSNCHGRGRCEDGRCVCDSGYTGPSCATRTCPANCRGRGRCVQGACVCRAGYSGEDCGQEEPPASACPGGCGPRELCRAGQCVCVEGFRGPDCAIQTCPGDCLGRGECLEGRCVCQAGYAGEDCGEEVPAIEGIRMHLLEETTVRTEWTRAPGPVDAYEIQFIPTTHGASPPFMARVPSSASAYDQRGLAPGQEYQVTVRALRGTNWGPPASKTITTMIDGPQDLRVVAVTPTTLELSWLRPQAEVDRFVVSYVSAGNQRVRLVVPSEADGTVLTDLMPGVEYVVTVTAERGRAVSYPASVRASTGSSPLGLLGATDEPPPSGPSTTQGAQAPGLQQRPQELGELRVLGRDKTGHLRVVWTAQPDTFAHFQLHLRVPDGSGTHEELLPGDVRQALVPSPPPGMPYELSLRGVPPEGKPSAPLIYQGIMDRDEEKPGKPLVPPHLGELTVTDVTSNSLLLHWTVPEGTFDSFVIQYKDRDGPQVVPVEGPQRSAPITNLDMGRKYKFVLYGLVGKKRHGPRVAEAKIVPQRDPSPAAPPRLGMLWVTDPSPDSLHLSWTVPEGQFDSFMVQYRDRDGRPQVVPVEGPERSVIISPLDPDHKYRFTLFGIANKKRHGPLTADGTTAPEKREEPRRPERPAQPLLGEVTVAGSTPDSLRLSWTVAQGTFDSFLVQYKDAQGQPQAVPVAGDENEVTVPGLKSDRKYKMNLYGLHGRQRVGPVSVVATTAHQEVVEETFPTEPSTEAPEPRNEPVLGELMVTGSSPNSLHLSWTVPEGEFDHFLVQYKNGDGQPKAVRVPGHKDEVTISGLEPDHKYKMNLYGFRGDQRQGPVSAIGVTAAEEEPLGFTEAPEPPEEPVLGELTVTGSSPDSLSLSWTVPQGHFESFTVQYKDSAGRPQVVRVGGEESEVTVWGLEPGRKYKMHLYGLHGGRREGPVSTVGVTAPQSEETPPATEPPMEPRLGELTVTDVTPNSMGLVWTVPEGQFDSFVVQYKDGNGQLQVVPVAADQHEATIPGLEPAHKYKMNVYGLHGGRRVGPLSVVAVTVPLPPAPATESPQKPRLGELTVTDVTSDSVALSWTVPQGKFDSFVVQYKDRNGQPQVVPVAADQREATVPDLEPNRKYKFLLFGIQDGKRRSPVSVEAKTATQGDTSPGSPPRLGELWVTDPTLDSLRLSWTVPEGHFNSFVVQFKDRDGPRVVPVEGHERSVTITPLDTGRKYRFLLYGLLGKKRHGPVTADGTTETQSAVEDPGTKRPPKLSLGEELQVTSVTPDSVGLSWMVPEGQFDSFVVQYKDKGGRPQVVPVGGSSRAVIVSGLDPAHRYQLLLYGLREDKRVGPLSAIAVTAPREEIEAETSAPRLPEPEPQLGALTVDEATPHTMHLSWTVSEGEFDSFEVQYTDQDGQLQVVSLRGDQNDITLSGLKSDHRYLVTLYGFHGWQRVGPTNVEALTTPREEEDEPSEPPTTDPEPPIKPRLGELAVTDATPNSLRLSWTVPEGEFDHFLVQYKNGDGQPKAVRVPGHEDKVTISGLEPDHKYKMNLYGFRGDQRQGPVSAIGVTAAEEEPLGFTEAPEPPEEPVLGELTVTGSSPDSLSLSWTVPQGHFESFTVQYKDSAGRPQVVRVGGEESEVTVWGLEPGRKYKMHLYGLHGGRREGPVSTVGVTAPEEEPPASPALKPQLGELTVTDATPDSLRLSWTVPEGEFDHFLVQYKNGDGQPKAVRVPGHEDKVTISGLEPDHKYKMNLYGFHDGQRQGPVSVVGLTASRKDQEMTPTPTDPPTMTPEPPIKPRLGELAVTDATPNSLHLSWTIPEGEFDHFLVQYKNGDGQPKAVRVSGHKDEVTISGLEPDHKYKMNLYGFRGDQRQGPVSAIGVTAAEEEPLGFTEAPEPPEEPVLGELTVTGSSPDSLSLSWTVPQGHFESFTVQYKDSAGRPQVVRVGGEESEVTVWGLEPGRKYKMHLYGLHGGRREGPVSTVGVTAPQVDVGDTPFPTEPSTEAPEPPEEPVLGELTVTGSSPDSLSLSWTVPQGHFESFTVQYKDSAGRPQVVRVGGDESEVTVWDLEPGRKYKMHLYGLHGGRREGPVSTVGVTASLPTEPPVAPRLEELAVAAVTSDTVQLSWTVAQGLFDSFLVQYRDAQGQPQAVPVGGDSRKVVISGLVPAHKYKFLLFGLQDEKRHGPLSADAKTLPDTKPSPRLGELAVTDVTPDSVALSWTVPEGEFDSFMVRYKDRDGRPQVVPVAADQLEATISGLAPNWKYKFLLFGLAGRKQLGPLSAEGTTAPLEKEQQPSPPFGELMVTDETPDSLRLSWTVAKGPFDSFVVQYWDTDRQPQALLVGGDQNKVLVSGLEPNTPYKFFLYGLREGKRLGPVSTQGTTGSAPAGQTPGDPGPRLSHLSVTDVTTSSLRLNWEAPPGAFDSFLLRYGVPLPSTLEPHPRPLLQRELTVPGMRQSAVLRDLRPGTLYSLTLYGLRGPHKADSVQGAARTLSPILESPRDLQFSEIGETSAKVSWMPPPSRVDSFKVSYQLADGGEPQSVQVDGRARTQELKGLIPGARYEVTVVSVRGFEESEPLTDVLITVPDGPTQLRALNLMEGNTMLHWKPPQAPVDTYDIRVTAPGAPPLQASAPGSAVDHPLHGLVPHTNYTATVHGLRGPNLTSPASIIFTTGLEGPQDLEAKEVTPRTALLTWIEPQVPPTGYLLTYDTLGGQTQILLPGGVTSHRLLGLFPSTTYTAWLQAVWGESFASPVSTSFTTGGLRVPFPRDCGEEMQNGAGTSRTTTIFLNGNREQPLNVFCDMETDGGGWLVFQRRLDGRTDFWRDWEEYAHGFGNISGEFWLGNEVLHSLTKAGDYSMRVDLRAGDEAVFAQYDSFRVDSAADYYRLHLAGYHGTAGDSMSYHSGSVFSARDRDPNNLLISCAVSYRGAWWYRNCHYANLNGLYGSTVDHQGVSWYHWKGFEFSVPFTEMKLRPRSYRAPA